MAKSSYAVALLFAGWSADAAAQAPASPVSADAAVKREQQWVGGAVAHRCPASGPLSDQEIVVCGRTHRQPELSPLPIQRDPGEIVRHVGEAGGADLNACYASCERPVTINPIAVIVAIPKVVRHILHGDD